MIITKNNYNFEIDEDNKEVRVFGHGMKESEDSIKFRREVALKSLQMITSDYTMLIDCRRLYLVNQGNNHSSDFDSCLESMRDYYMLGYRKFRAKILPTQTLMLQIAEKFKIAKPDASVVLDLVEEEQESNTEDAFNFINDVLFKTLKINYDAASSVTLSEMLEEFKNLFAVINPKGYTLNFKFLNKHKLETNDMVNFLKNMIPEIRKYELLSVVLNVEKDFPVNFLNKRDLAIFQFE